MNGNENSSYPQKAVVMIPLFKKEHLITGIDIGSHAIKVCQLQRVGRDYKIIAIGSALLPAGVVEDGVLQEPEEVGKILSKLLNISINA